MKLILKSLIINAILIATIFYPSEQNYEINYLTDYKASPSDYQYKIRQSITYQVEVNFSLTHNSLISSQYLFKFSRFNDRQPNSTLAQDTPPFQQSSLIFSNISGSGNTPHIARDQFNNTYDVFNNTLSSGQSITLDQRYLIKLNEITFPDINYSKIKPYDTSKEIFELYCNNSEVYYEKDDPDLNSTSYTIVNKEDNPIQKAIKICNWVSNYLTYDDSLPAEEYGAKWALDNERGDCSEYSTLMITLLRCQGIPARKITGYVITNDASIRPYIGQTWKFTLSNGNSNFLGHAWVEYYVEGIGWIACDPTWNTQGDYVNRIDYLRLNLNVGAWFSIPGGLPDQSEFPHPCIVYQSGSNSDYIYTVAIKVIEIDLLPFDLTLLLLISIPSGSLIIGGASIILIRKKRRRKQTQM